MQTAFALDDAHTHPIAETSMLREVAFASLAFLFAAVSVQFDFNYLFRLIQIKVF